MEGVGNFGDVFRLEIAQDTVFHVAELPRVDEQHLAMAAAPAFALGLAAGQEPDAGRYLGVGEQLARQSHHALHQIARSVGTIAFNEGAADVALGVGVAAHGAVGQQQGHAAVGAEVVDHVLHPRKVGIAIGRHAVLPARVVVAHALFPRLHVERRVGHDEVCAQVGVLRARVSAGGLLAKIKVQPANGHVHGGQAPGGGVGLLAVNADLADLAAVLQHKALALHEEAA